MTNFFPNLPLRKILLKHLDENFGFGSNFNENSEGVPSEYALALFDGSQLDPVKLVRNYILPEFTVFAKEAVSELVALPAAEQEVVLRIFEKRPTCMPATTPELFADFCREQELIRNAISPHLAENTGTAQRYVVITKNFQETIKDYDSLYVALRWVGTSDKLKTSFDKKLRLVMYSLLDSLAICAVLPPGEGHNDPNLLNKFDHLLQLYADISSKFKVLQTLKDQGLLVESLDES